MRSLFYSALALLFTVTACAQPKWSLLESKAGQFTVSMPGQPTETSRIIKTPSGDVTAHMWAIRRGDAAFMVMYSDYPAEYVKGKDSQSILDSARDGAVANTQGVLLSEVVVALGPYPGREVKIAVANGEAASRDRVFLVGRRLYQLIYASPKAQSYSPDIDRFLNSFKLVSGETSRYATP